MPRLTYVFLCLPLIIGSFGLAAGCGKDAEEPADPLHEAGVDADSGHLYPDALFDVTDGCATTCSADLHDVIGCDGKVVRTCGPTEGCEPGTGACIPACESANANKSSIGCDFFSVLPEGSFAGDSCYAVVLANTWTDPVGFTVEFRGYPFKMEKYSYIPEGTGRSITYEPLTDNLIPPGKVAILFLSGVGCVHDFPTPHAGPNTRGTMIGESFHIITDRPVVAYDYFPYGVIENDIAKTDAIVSATLLLPTSAWDTNYVMVDPYTPVEPIGTPPSMQIVAKEDNTQVTIVPTVDIAEGEGVAAAPKNVPTTYTLHRGQVLGMVHEAGLSGTIVSATKPVGLWSSVSVWAINEDPPVGYEEGESAHQQIPPVKALGSEYVAVRYRNRVDGFEESPPWRIMGVVDGTELSYDPAPPEGAPTRIDAGQVVNFSSPGPFVVRSQDGDHPFYFAAHMTGCSTLPQTPYGCLGDVEFVNVVPAAQALSSYVFYANEMFPETNLVLVREKKDGAFHDVEIDCAGKIEGWRPVGDGSKYEYSRFDLSRHDFEGQNGCDTGIHRIWSDAPFNLTVWGWGSDATGGYFDGGVNTKQMSYAYPAGQSIRSVNPVVIPPIPK